MRLAPSTLGCAIALALVSALAACSSPEDAPVAPEPSELVLPPGTDVAAEAIDAETIETAIRDLASDAMGGRGPGSEGDHMAQQYIADAMAGYGLEPGGPDGSWFQPFDIVGITAKPPETWSFSANGQTVRLDFWDEYIAASGVQSESSDIRDAEVVFVGYGIDAPEHHWNDFKDADLRGKVLLMMNNDPDWDPDLFAGETRLYYGRWTYKYESAAQQGAVGAIIIHTAPSAGYPWQVVQTSWTGEQFELPWVGEPRLQVAAWATEEATRSLVGAAGFDLDELRQSAQTPDFEPVPLGIKTSLHLDNTLTHNQTANVLGLIRGSDPELSDEVVVFTAHHDHLGMAEDDGAEDIIYNGAIDNAAGVAMVLAAAKAAAALPQPPRRSLLFAMVGGEEQGLLGSQYFAQNPTFPPGKIAANVNLDGGNPYGRTTDVAYVGFGKSTLDAIAVAAAARQQRTVTGDQFPDKGYFYRSDQFNFAKIGVPAFYMESGTNYVGRPPGWGKAILDEWTEKHYHQVSDEFSADWDWAGFIDDARLALDCGLAVAQLDEMPTWNPGDEFEAARLAALAAVE